MKGELGWSSSTASVSGAVRDYVEGSIFILTSI